MPVAPHDFSGARRRLYFDCFAGISGDMTLGALIDLGVPPGWLQENLDAVPLKGFELIVESVVRNGIRCKNVEVKIDPHPPERHYGDIRALIEQSALPPRVKMQSLEIFERIAAAEARVHGCDKEAVHFHEVGAVDAMVDIIGTALGMSYLGVAEAAASKLPLGGGTVTCAHGVLPVPAPATVAILEGVPVFGGGIEGELVTPTGAAIVRTLAEAFGPLPEMQIEAIGYGAGKSDLGGHPNLLRLILGAALPTAGLQAAETVMVVETNIDDMNPEIFGFSMERLFAAGALDVCWVPAFMKKNRPGTLVQVLCPADALDAITACLLSETTAIGLRYHEAHRRVLEREATIVDTPLGPVAAKKIRDLSGSVRIVPEFEACRLLANQKGLSLRVVYETVLKHA